MTENLFTVLCGASKNLQEALKKKNDLLYCTHHKKYKYSVISYCPCSLKCNFIKRPRQEDLQKLYEKEKGYYPVCNPIHLDRWAVKNSFFSRVYEKVPGINIPELWNLLWLLFVCKELWDQVCDFKNKKWVEAK